MPDIPALIPTVKVVAWLSATAADGSDEGRVPDLIPMQGTVTFTPNISRVRVAGSAPPLTLFPRPTVANLDPGGFLTDSESGDGVVLIATGALIPTYTIRFDLIGQPAFSINAQLPPGPAIDLSTIIELPVNVPAELALWRQTVARAEAAVKAAEAIAESILGSLALVESVNGKTGKVVLKTDDIAEGLIAKYFTVTERRKLLAIAEGATANESDYDLRDRSTHHGKQSVSTIEGLNEAIQQSLSAFAAGAPETLNSIDELANAIGDDPNFAVTIANLVTAKDATAVHKTGAETIAGVKTFSMSPLVPVPTVDGGAANKKYVDDKVAAIPPSTGGGSATTDAAGITTGVFDPARLALTANATIPARGTGGVLVPLAYSSFATADALARRTAQGTLRAASPIADDDLGTKAYIDAKVAAGPNGAGGAVTAAALGWLLVEDFGAVGDGVTSDTAAWNNAIQAGHAQNRVVRGAKHKRYFIDGTVSASNVNCTILNEGSFVIAAAATAKISALHNPESVSQVESVALTVIGPVGGEVPPSDTERANVLTLADQAQLQRYRLSDKIIVYSSDIPPDVNSPGNTAGANQYAGNMAVVHGIIIPISPTSTALTENANVVGVTSKATGQVGSITTDAGAAGSMILKFASGTFQSGETITVNGTAVGTISGAGKLLLKTRLIDAFTTSIRIRKLTTFATNISTALEAAGDFDNELGTTTHPDAITIGGGSRSRINIRAFGLHGPALRVAGSFAPIVEIEGDGGANSDPARAYSYLVEMLGSCLGGSFKVNGVNVRHLFTSNPTSIALTDTGAGILFTGRPNHNTVRDSDGLNCYGPAFDLHDGANATHFVNCHNRRSTGARRKYSGVAGFQNRGFNTTYTLCSDDGSVNGFIDMSANDVAPFFSLTTYDRCRATNVQERGFMSPNDMEQRTIDGVANVRNHGITTRDLYVSFDPSAGAAYPFQVAYDFASGDVAMYGETVAIGFNGAPLRWKKNATARTAVMYVNHLVANYSGADANTTGIQVAEAGHNMLIENVTMIARPGLALPSVFRGVGSSPSIRIANPPVVVGTTTAPALLSQASGATATVARAVTVALP